ncbi:hypothetical protein LZ31DRAFT_281146 [Colletotrichum somersetense]|nr:hypothetical protein LZ31DRAFT_281146 [Colletotrichum somersetense]
MGSGHPSCVCFIAVWGSGPLCRRLLNRGFTPRYLSSATHLASSHLVMHVSVCMILVGSVFVHCPGLISYDGVQLCQDFFVKLMTPSSACNRWKARGGAGRRVL